MIDVIVTLIVRWLLRSLKGLLTGAAALNLLACAREAELCEAPVAPNDDRPDILVIGDSISYGYLQTLKDGLPGFDVIHNPCNGKDAPNGAKHISSWLNLRPQWYAVLFNHGAWDVSPRREVDGGDYAEALRFEATLIKQRTGRPLFVTTTSVPEFDRSRSVGSELAYNEIARGIMDSLGIPWVDLHALSLTIPHLRMRADAQDDVHWTDAGSAIFGGEILGALSSLYGIN